MRLRRALLGPPQDLCRHAAAFGLNRFEQIERLDGPAACLLFGNCNDLPDARRNEDTLPEAVLAGSQRTPNLGMHFARVDSFSAQTIGYRAVGLFQQRNQQMFDADVVMVVIAALLFGRT